jgi:hypothetical protein
MFSSLPCLVLNFEHFMLSKYSNVTQESIIITFLFVLVIYVMYYVLLLR